LEIKEYEDKDFTCLRMFIEGLSKRTYELWYPPTLDELCLSEDRHKKYYVLVYWHQWKIIGCAFYKVDKEFSDYPSIGIAIADDYQGLGIGRKLMDTLFTASIKNGFKGLYVGVLKTNKNAIDFYTALDFKIIGEKTARNGEPAWEMRKK